MSSRKTAAAGPIVLAALLSLPFAACTDSTIVQEPATLNLATSADSIASNGLTSVVVTAELPASLPQDASVEFTTTLGKWANPGGTPDRKVTVRARSGVAEARLFATGEVGTAYVTVSGAGTTAQTTVELTSSLPEIVDLFIDRTIAPADGSTAVTATAILRRATGAVSRGIPVRFEVRDSTGAALPELGGVIVADSAGTAQFRFTLAVPGRMQVRAYAGGVESEARTVRFTPPPVAAPAGASAALTLTSGGIPPLTLREAQ